MYLFQIKISLQLLKSVGSKKFQLIAKYKPIHIRDQADIRSYD